ncbi:MAG TPA: DUF2961 domain-containing protein [Candidatus Hydrogenedentes bacterium]|nr:DUF2961 domain-containing protein [Candidatus Hydrogenedentota bacterium]
MRVYLKLFLFVAYIPLALGQGDVLSELTRAQQFETRRESSAKEDLTKNGDSRPIEAGETLVLGDLEGPGVITHLWSTVNSKDPFFARSLVVRVYYDGADKPSVEAPYGDFFGIGHAAGVSFESTAITTSRNGRSRNCWWHMPFKQRARVTVTNESSTYRTDSFYYYLDWQKHQSLPEDTVYFHAQYRQAHPAQPGPYVFLDTKGRGHVAGVVYSVLQTQLGWFGEGDDRFYVDNSEKPQLSGTGTEDYFGDAWGFKPFAYAQHGIPLFEGYMPGDRVSAYRWHLSDPVTFNESIRFEIEHFGSLFTESLVFLGQFHERPDWLSSVAFWYQTPPITFSDPIAPLSERVPPYKVISAGDLAYRANPETGVMKSNGEVAYLPRVPDATISFDFTVEQPGRYRLRAIMGHAFLGGLYQPSLDGKPIGEPLSFYINDEDTLWHDFDNHDLAAGTHTLTFEGRGLPSGRRAATPNMNALRLDALVLLRLEDLAGYLEATKRALEQNRAK